MTEEALAPRYEYVLIAAPLRVEVFGELCRALSQTWPDAVILYDRTSEEIPAEWRERMRPPGEWFLVRLDLNRRAGED